MKKGLLTFEYHIPNVFSWNLVTTVKKFKLSGSGVSRHVTQISIGLSLCCGEMGCQTQATLFRAKMCLIWGFDNIR